MDAKKEIPYSQFDSTSLLHAKVRKYVVEHNGVKFKYPIAFTINKHKCKCSDLIPHIGYNRVGETTIECNLHYVFSDGSMHSHRMLIDGLVRSQIIKLIKAINNNI